MQEFEIGQKVRLTTRPPYLKTADSMPMLRPPTLVSVGEEGTIVGRNPGGTWSVRFKNGAYLLDAQYLDLL
ncbi:MAG: DUF3148 domain-containing protein [Cyanobacteria bacterium SID2]|nr:DUF3148 domain-containing protein [Cyanobacteria bacterium SID2]MBP0004700.1 DUF3148 domain-containing protein [Cyanobacteria bacterium SBC]